MTSWINSKTKSKLPTKELGYSFSTTQAGFCSQFNNFFYAYLYAVSKDRKLFVCERNSALGFSVPFLKSVFKDNNNIEYTNYQMVQHPVYDSKVVYPYLYSLTHTELREKARKFFGYNDLKLEECDVFLSNYANIPKKFDMGIHIRSGDKITTREMSAIPIASYVTAIKDMQKKSGLKTLEIFVMTDNFSLFQKLKELADSSWSLFTLDSPTQIGHVQENFNTYLTRKEKQYEFNKFLTELLIMQNCPKIICTLSSNVGRYLYLNVESLEFFKSIDVPTFAPI